MRIIAPVFIALLAMIGVGIAEVRTIDIAEPLDGEIFELGSSIPIEIDCTASGNGYLLTQIFIDGIKSPSNIFVPEATGTYEIMALAADNPEFANALSDTVTITVIDSKESGKQNAPGQIKKAEGSANG
jgi:hypothetical protein